MKRPLRSSLFAISLLSARFAFCQSILPPDPNEPAGERPYEMVWANRTEPAPPTLRFDQLDHWGLELTNGAQATLQVTRAQNVWDRPVARLRYHGDGNKDTKPVIVLTPPEPVTLPDHANCLDMWVYGNRWDWENPPGTPSVDILLKLRDSASKEEELRVDHVRWQEWWLMHRKLPESLLAHVQLLQIKISGGWQTDWREIFFDSIRFYHEELSPIKFATRPQRNLRLAEGQSVGVNSGPGQLPFPVRELTILPMHFGGKYSNGITDSGAGHYSFDYRAKDCAIVYSFDPIKHLDGVEVWVNDHLCGRPFQGASIKSRNGPVNSTLKSVKEDNKTVVAEYSDGTTLRLQIKQKSLIVDVSNTTCQATELNFGQISCVTDPRTVPIPFLTYGGGPRPSVLLSRVGTNYVFSSTWLDWYRSNGSEPYAAESTSSNTARINGGVRYHPRTDGKLNPLFERIFVTVSPTFEEVLPTIPNPIGLHAKEAVDRLWQESWGPDDYEKQMKRSGMLRAYGIEKMIQCNHEIAWRDGGESFTLRTRAAPKKGGDAALAHYVAHQRGLGWLEGLYSNYTDYAPVNEFWDPDGVQRLSDGNWRSAWPRCWAEKPLKAVEFDALLAPQIKKKYNPNSAYTDVQTAVSPWGYNDYDARVPGGGTFAQTFYAYGELLRNDSKVYGGPIFSEGTYQWLYAGLADGNYALAYDGHPLAKEPLLPVFDLYQIHSRECDIGMGWTANFCDAIPDWKKPENIDHAIDRFLLHTLAYGHIGWLVEEEHGIERTCRSYYMLQQVQAEYGLKRPARVAYWDGGKLVSVSEALARDLPRTRRQLFVEYPGGLQLWLNDHPNEIWRVYVKSASMTQNQPTVHSNGGDSHSPLLRGDGRGEGSHLQRDTVDLPPAGWTALTQDGKLYSFSALDDTNRVDYLRSRDYTYLDGRGHRFDAPEAASDGGLVIRPLAKNKLSITRISGRSPFVIRRPYRVHGACTACEAFDMEEKASAGKWEDTGQETRITPDEKAIRYVVTFGDQAKSREGGH